VIIMSTEDVEVRLATLMTTVMNIAGMLADEALLHRCEPTELRSTLLEVADEMVWLGSRVAAGKVGGVTWPEDAEERIERLRFAAAAWGPAGLPPAEVREAARRCLGILQPGLAQP
jgi:hypothetical protein